MFGPKHLLLYLVILVVVVAVLAVTMRRGRS
jgi:hypothetical protein